MKTTVELVGPAEAAAMLQGNRGNRPIERERVSAYAADMLAGRWSESFDAVGVTPEGQLINGQHRLTAIVESGCSINLQVSRDADPDTFWRAFDAACATAAQRREF